MSFYFQAPPPLENPTYATDHTCFILFHSYVHGTRIHVCLYSWKKTRPLIRTCLCMGTIFSALRTISSTLWTLRKTRSVLILGYVVPKIRPSPSADKSRFFFNCVPPCLIAPPCIPRAENNNNKKTM